MIFIITFFLKNISASSVLAVSDNSACDAAVCLGVCTGYQMRLLVRAPLLISFFHVPYREGRGCS